jgi:hypothetical protein
LDADEFDSLNSSSAMSRRRLDNSNLEDVSII